MLQSLVSKKLLSALDNLAVGSLKLTVPEGQTYEFHGDLPGANAEMIFHDWNVITRMIIHGDIGLTEDYRDGRLETPDLTALLLFGLQNREHLLDFIRSGFVSRMFGRARYFLFHRNTLKGSKRNVHAHYDLGNEFYKEWLDPGMSYSSAIYEKDSDDLLVAQDNKYDRILERLEVDSGRLMEVGCGWGGFADRALASYDIDYKGVTLSHEQMSWAEQRLYQRYGNYRADVALEDYRIQKGKYDYLVSIEMFEAVGQKYWPVYFEKVKSLLAQKGRAMIQTITIAEDSFDHYSNSSDMIRSFIFPGGMLPSGSQFDLHAEKAGLQVVDRYDFGLDYAKTLRAWKQNFESSLPNLKGLGFDEKFIRVWRFYLSACIATFETGRTNVRQVELRHA